ncbi:MAG: UTP--glucose-1-phosphate uridylyltransferase [uncultured Solirubrobacteraceae bacterium]|uniref:UTP--glucose-1-phosphate uridylyltransferase n=1 Tax=uncultured Solirubrobacteraceae bacterium TaxID=1162706 RepID=A0A6J4TZJ4_9ACTN|nr:MAG: UTP--glucose-1-phosphate uridylyltransferase [uncultured Solirubrobacteraceae bacterium]
MSTDNDGLTAAIEKMQAEGLGEAAVDTFRHYYELLRSGEGGMLPESALEPVEDVPDLSSLPDDAAGDALDQAVVLKLNGGLGTSMGMTPAKSLLEVKDGLSFLDVIVRQVLALRRETGARLPLVLMNSFNTRDDSLAALHAHESVDVEGLPLDFVQNKVPKIRADDLMPVEWPANPAQEWAPPGHGDLYTALVTSGMLDTLLEQGFRYAFVSNADNLGAVFEPRILSWFAREEIPFLLEVTDRTEADRKGGHVARRREEGGLVLREVAQTPEEDVEAFQDIARHRFFNTNNLWLDLRALREVLDVQGGVLGLPMIVNRKTVDPGDASSPEVIQLETAMGAAIDVFDDAQALRVSRERFVPVKTTSDLLVVRSDAYVLDDAQRLVLAPGRDAAPLVSLSSEYKLVGGFDERFPKGPPSLVEASRLTVEGDVTFGAGVVVRGSASVTGPSQVDDGAVLEG